ncbi:hypothetical protein [Actinoallomurus rhizosphaericola]|uniref:hypothetical protein n=1 Tax=Actinoallomurus rhizosphaericola TaxID=2952536 RepID=UPI0020935636|nr:hypothetical protein [Actinoallomurus rhizosphaericola]MCO5999251.1 hypothetical protein [Actinoallomurus rhizosphaericola]
MGLIVLAADKGAPGVTTAAVAIAAVWPRPVLLAECDQAGGDLVYRLPAEDGGMLNPARGMLSLAATARRGLRADQVWEHTQRLVGGLDVLVGLANAEQAQGLTWLWGPLGRAFASLGVPAPYADGAAHAANGVTNGMTPNGGYPVPGAGHTGNGTTPSGGFPIQGGPPVNGAGTPAIQTPVDVVADCGRLGAGSAVTDLLREASTIVLFTRATLEHVAHLRERINSLATELGGHAAPPIGVVVVADPREYRTSITEVGRIISNAELPASVLGGFALDPKGAEMLRGRWGGRLDRSLLIRSARQIAGDLAARAAGGPEGREAQGAASGSQSR